MGLLKNGNQRSGASKDYGGMVCVLGVGCDRASECCMALTCHSRKAIRNDEFV